MNILVAAVGKGRRGPERELFELYAKRLPWPSSLREVEVRRPSDAATRRNREAEMLLQAVPDRAMVVALDERGRTLRSADFAHRLRDWADDGVADVAFLIGGADGHGETVRHRADLLLSLGAMTWPHLLVRAMLAEQLYRAASILQGHPYHRE